MALVMIPNPKTQSKRSLLSGFTLLEMLLVVAIIAVLAGIVVVAINPGKQLATVRNTERTFNLSEIHKAMQQYFIDHYTYPAATPTTLTEICNTGSNSTSTGIDCTGLIDLSPLVPTYLTSIPVDPQGSTLSFINNLIPKVYATTNGTGYKVMKDTNNKIVLTAPQAELSAFIAIGTTTTATASCTATGGTITEAGGYCIHTFTTVGDDTFVVPSGSLTVDVLIVAGGGAGGNGNCGGGGAGGMLELSDTPVSGSVSVVVGEGGLLNGQGNDALNGENSSFGTDVSIGGGGGNGNPTSYGGWEGKDGGSGGGSIVSAHGGSGVVGQGNNGGVENGAGHCAGGGGGAGSVGGNVHNTYSGGDGGIGLVSNISGDDVYYAGGGGGCGRSNYGGVKGTGGIGGGGDGSDSVTATDGVNGTGGGGGGRNNESPGTAGAGGSGIVIVRYLK